MKACFFVIPAEAGIQHNIYSMRGIEGLLTTIVDPRFRGDDRSRKRLKELPFSKNLLTCVVSAFLFLLITFPVFSTEKSPVPRFVSIRPNEVNGRVGPGPDYPIEWIYLKAGLPVEVIAEFDTWRKIRDIKGDQSWVHQSMLSPKRHALIQNGEALMYSTESTNSQPLVRLQPGVVVELMRCHGEWCQVRIFDFKGWIQRHFLWGIYPQETLG